MKNNISHMLEKSGLCGAATMAIGVAFYGLGQAQWSIPGTAAAVPIEFLTFGIGALNSAVADGIHTFLNKAVPLGKKTADRSALITNAIVSGASFFALLHLGGANVPYQYTLMKAFVTGAGGELIGSAAYEYLLNNLYL